MLKNSFYFTCNAIVAAIVLLLGIIHNVATFTPIIEIGFENLSDGARKTMVFFSLGTGTATLMSGVLLLLLGGIVKIGVPKVKVLMYIVTLFLLIISMIAIWSNSNNPFAYIILVIGIIEFVIVFNLHTETK